MVNRLGTVLTFPGPFCLEAVLAGDRFSLVIVKPVFHRTHGYSTNASDQCH